MARPGALAHPGLAAPSANATRRAGDRAGRQEREAERLRPYSSSQATFTYPDRNGFTAPESGS
jgi:hypothetical protein